MICWKVFEVGDAIHFKPGNECVLPSPLPSPLRSRSWVKNLAVLKRAFTRTYWGWPSKGWQHSSVDGVKFLRTNGRRWHPGEWRTTREGTWVESCTECLKREKEVLVMTDKSNAMGKQTKGTVHHLAGAGKEVKYF